MYGDGSRSGPAVEQQQPELSPSKTPGQGVSRDPSCLLAVDENSMEPDSQL